MFEQEINSFIGTLTLNRIPISVNLENTMWANTVVASGTALGLVIYTGQETRASMNNSKPRSKTGKIDRELNILIIVSKNKLKLKYFCPFGSK